MKGVFQACKTPNHSIKGLRSILELWQSLQEHSHTKTDSAKLDLSLAKLAGADLYKANLPHANLHKADLKRALLQEANLREANLTGANLQEADLRWVNLTGAVLRGANLRKADLDFSCLKGAKNLTKRQLQGAKSIKRAHHGRQGYSHHFGRKMRGVPAGETLAFTPLCFTVPLQGPAQSFSGKVLRAATGGFLLKTRAG